ncbi:UDP-N-acetylmuramate--L-alanine ligase [Cytophaga hutchinsonii]|uniref:UDP-N-acetylmuramate--L-alanine ligase n=1 Tax=Cytophaga hutchinsonii (strain ATCC 33406 / DSM 1761 / CIP 103989 / NBRC 15051 / NCIMB 9469 / D465) TaxID=269798 RepID=MURC_CYTH3|nr:UDP-N-acetylmuramate--L-alanine ligase [Cytophaga hutchinsonii]Q11RH6.1 RecName: Full=UDP-N-acetylmuramate--L-alanine ligase; AltName: Full=UDP-N-acetylmuramoyl-L-alanine synthetase [Cytophaga hutchinsonii ATCC 33406]ABG59988.1 UDP-N-acetylmuramate--L-alanine ligase [Cytophaga hutchinsonii ATCC 33406]SFX26161.1 UDP-N-acetylmuramate--L-alanine ligase [Cytophaga hutchinsonii ATCC 33406]
MNLTHIHSVYLIGIGGIGMSALARWFKQNNYNVGGYDKTSSDLTKALEAEGMAVHYTDSMAEVPEAFTKKDSVLVIYTPAIPADHLELNFFRENGYALYKRSQVLGFLTKELKTIGIAGTHGKTTTSSMAAHIMHESGMPCSAFLGGITQNYNTNILIGNHGDGAGWVVAEADEYDRSFLQLSPDIAVINNMDPDHLDIYSDVQSFYDSFNEYLKKLKPGGIVIRRVDVDVQIPSHASLSVTFGESVEADYRIQNVVVEDGGVTFSIDHDFTRWNNIRIEMPGMHNVMNATAAFLAAHFAGVSIDSIKASLRSFGGVKRRFEYIYKNTKLVYVDDYAHHPTELEALLKAVRMVFPGKKVVTVFQPHLFSRTRDFMQEFAQSLALTDELLLMEIYPARELPIEGITSDVLLNLIPSTNKKVVSKESLLTELEKLNFDVVITAGAGDIDRFIQPIKLLCEQRYGKANG